MKAPIIADTQIPGWSSRNELGLLGSLASSVRTRGTIVELGSFAGRTAFILAKNCPSAKVFCIDPWGHFDIRSLDDLSLTCMNGDLTSLMPGELYEVFLRNTADCPNIVPIRGLSTEIEWEQSWLIDLLFIDANHETDALIADLKTWWPRMDPNGIVVGHDWQMRSVRDACIQFLDFLNENEKYPQLLNFPAVSIWGLLKGVEHANRWGVDFGKLYPFGDEHSKQLRELEEVKRQVSIATRDLESSSN